MMLTMTVACGNKSGSKKESPDIGKSVSDEIADGISEDAVPVEATIYSSVSFNLPEGYAPDEDNTEELAYYFNDEIDDLSYIAYSKNKSTVDYDNMQEGDYADAFLAQYNVNINFIEFEKQIKEDYYRIRMVYDYSFGDIDYRTTEYLFVTDNYTFTVSFCWDKSSTRTNQFSSAEKSLSLVSVINTIKDSQTPGTDVTNETKDDDSIFNVISSNEISEGKDFLKDINAGVAGEE